MARIIFLLLISIVFVQSTSLAARIRIKTNMDVPEFNFYIDSVILVQEEQHIIGHRIRHKKLIDLDLKEKRIDNALQNLFQRSFPLKDDKRRLILKINRILFNTYNKNSEFGANITFIEKVNGEYLDLGTINSFWTNENTLSSPYSSIARGQDLVKSLEFLFSEFLDKEASINEQKILSLEELSNPIIINSSNYPIIDKPQQIYKGVILSYEDFINANVIEDSSLEFEKIEFRKTTHNKLNIKTDNYEKEELWGVYDGENYYINERNFFRPLLFLGNRIIIHAPSQSDGFIDEIPDALSILTSFIVPVILKPGLTFGQAFVITVGAATIVYFITAAIVKASKKYVYYELDLLTGLANQIEFKQYKP